MFAYKHNKRMSKKLAYFFKVSEYPQRLKILKATFSWSTVFPFD